MKGWVHLWGGWGLAFQAKEKAYIESWRLKRLRSAFTFLIEKLYSNSVLLEYVEWENDGK